MKLKSLIISILSMIIPVISTCIVNGSEEKKVDIMFLHDTHSHLNPFSTIEDEESKILGGFARIKTIINLQKKNNPDTLILDAGDFSMGTLVQVVYEEEAAELRMLGDLGIEYTTLGNHEFDYRADGLANMLNSAVASGDTLPDMLVCNIDWDGMAKNGYTQEQILLKETFESYGVKKYDIVEKNGVRIAVIGVFGDDAYSCVVDCPLVFDSAVNAVKKTVKEIKKNENADMIVCVSHSGTWSDPDVSEDEILAKKVPELDLIISGHTHTKLDKPIRHGDTYIVSAQEYGKYIGNLSMTQKDNKRWEMDTYELIPIDESVESDFETQAKVDTFMSLVDSRYLSRFGYTKDQIICTNSVVFATSNDVSTKHTEMNLGSIMADAYAYAVNNYADEDTNPVDVAFVPSGTIRDTYALGDITIENVFNSFSLGIGSDDIPGYPLISVYLTGKELKIAAEIDASISDIMNVARLYTYGLRWTYNPHRIILNKVTDVHLYSGEKGAEKISDKKLYRVVTDYYTAKMLAGVTDMSYGLLSIKPKDVNGNQIKNYEDAIIMADGKELKAWVAIAQYMDSFEDTDGDGIGEVPLRYASDEGRKNVQDSWNLWDLVKSPNKFFFIIIGIVILLSATVIYLLIKVTKGIIKIIRKIRKKMVKDE